MCKVDQNRDHDNEYTLEEVAKHNRGDDCWIVLGEIKRGELKVYDATPFMIQHPGGPEVITEVAGTYAHTFFEDIGHSSEAREELENLMIGRLKISDDEMETLLAASNELKTRHHQNGGNIIFIFLILIIAIAAGIYKSHF